MGWREKDRMTRGIEEQVKVKSKRQEEGGKKGTMDGIGNDGEV